MALFATLPLAPNLLIFAALAAVIWIAGTRLSYLADAIGDRADIGQAIMGAVFLASITELPELVTTATASLKGDAPLALNNMFGGITMQTAILAVADIVALKVTVTAFPRKPTVILEGVVLILLLAVALTVISIGDVSLVGHIGMGAFVLAGVYVLSLFVLNRYDKTHAWRPVNLVEPPADEVLGPSAAMRGLSMRALVVRSCGAAGAILLCGVVLVEVASVIAAQSGLGSSFIGVTLLAVTTSLPELSTTIAAVRMGAYTMAISNIFGSNLIMVFVLFPADVFYREGAILRQADDMARLALLSGIVVTAIYVIGLLIKKKRRVFGMGVDSLVVLCVYLGTLVAFYQTIGG